MNRKQIETWLEDLANYGPSGYWYPTREAFEELCHLALKGLTPPEEASGASRLPQKDSPR